MDIDRLTSMVHALSATPSRRRVSRVLAGFTATSILAPLVDPISGQAKRKKHKKKHKKKKKHQEDDLPQCLLECGDTCCTEAQPACCNGTVSPLCYDPATESCCPDLGGQFGAACPFGTSCEFFDDPYDTLGPSSFCCPSSTTTCVDGCCPDGTVCCPYDTGFGVGANCCADSSCDEVATDCMSNGDLIVDPRTF
jgi:hypothetical protein